MHSTSTPDHRCPESLDGAIALALNQSGGLTIDGVRHTTILSAMAAVASVPAARLADIGKRVEDALGGLVRVTCDYDCSVWQRILASHGIGHRERVAV